MRISARYSNGVLPVLSRNNGTVPPDSGLPPLRARTAKPLAEMGRQITFDGIHGRSGTPRSPAYTFGRRNQPVIRTACQPSENLIQTHQPLRTRQRIDRADQAADLGRQHPVAETNPPATALQQSADFGIIPPDAPYSAGTGRAEIAEPRPNSLRRPLPGAPGRTDGNEAARCLTAPNPRPDKVPPHRRRTATPGPK